MPMCVCVCVCVLSICMYVCHYVTTAALVDNLRAADKNVQNCNVPPKTASFANLQHATYCFEIFLEHKRKIFHKILMNF